MRRNVLAAVTALAGLAFVALATACSDDGKTTVVNTGNGPDQGGISVNGRGEVQSPPDTAFFTVGIETKAANVADARNTAATAADNLIKSVKANGVADTDIKTSGLSITPNYTFIQNQDPRLTGYTVTNTIDVKVKKLDTIAKVVDDAVAAGGNASRLRNIRFTIEDNNAQLEKARQAAMDDAKKKAQQYASLSGVKLGAPIAISESSAPAPQPVQFAAPAASGARADDVSTPIQPGTNSVTVTVNVRWSIAK